MATCPASASGAPSCTCNSGFVGTLTFSGGAWTGTCTPSAVVWQSSYNGNQVKSYKYNGPSTTFTWQVEFNVCNAAGKLCPGTTISAYWNQYCSYSSTSNWIVTGDCNWATQAFTYVSGSVPAGFRALMCAHSNCDHWISMTGTSRSYTTSQTTTINNGDFVLCQP